MFARLSSMNCIRSAGTIIPVPCHTPQPDHRIQCSSLSVGPPDPPAAPRRERCDYFFAGVLGAAAGAALGVVVATFLCFFTCFLAAGALGVDELAGALFAGA